MGRVNLVSPGAMAGDAISQYFERLALGKRAELQDQLAIEREKRLGEQHKADIELRKAEILSQGEYRKAQIEAQAQLATQRGREDATARLSSYDKGNAIRPEDAEIIGKHLPGSMDDQMTLPARTLAMGVVAPGAEGASTGAVPGVIASAPTGQKISRGTPAQRLAAQQQEQQEAFLKTLDPNSPQAQYSRGRQALGADAPPFQAYVNEQAVPEVRTAGGALFERQQDGTWKQVAQGPASENGGGREYWALKDLADGAWMINTRNPNERVRIGDSKPGETAQRELANGQTIMWMMDQMTANMTPEKIGPVMGRVKSVEEAVTGGDPAFSALAAQTAQLQNVVINLRTGAAMSEPEAARILAELPQVSLPPATYIARLKNAQSYYKQWQQNRARGAYGRTTTSDVDRMVSPGAGPTPTGEGRNAMDDLYDAYTRGGR